MSEADEKKDTPQFDFSGLNFNFNTGSGGSSGFNFNSQPLLGNLSSTLESLVGTSSGYLESLPKKVQNRISALRLLHEQYEDLDKQLEDEVRQLQLKYDALYEPLFIKRAAIVSGEVEPEQVEKEKKEEEEEEEKKEKEEEKKEDSNATPQEKSEETAEEKKEENVKGIPDFWLMALKNHHSVAQNIDEADEEALKYLLNISHAPVPDKPKSFILNFHFGSNPFFSNDILQKTYHMGDNEEGGNELVCETVDATEILWKEGKNLTEGRKGLGSAKGSFFFFFSPPNVPQGKEPSQKIVEQMELDFELATSFRDEIIPQALLWYTGEAISESEYDDNDGGMLNSNLLRQLMQSGAIDGGDDDDDYDDEDDEDDDDDSDGGDEDYEPKQGEKAADCKQQ